MDYAVIGLIGRISELATYIDLKGKHHVFFHNYGHTKEIVIRVYVGGWDEEKTVEVETSAYYDINHYHSEEGREAALEEIIQTLEYFK